MYYYGMQFNNIEQIGLATSTDAENWNKYVGSPIIPYGGQAWCTFRKSPNSVIYEDGIYKMWFYGNEANANYTNKVGYAYSTDNVNWTLYEGNPVISVDNYHVCLVEMIKFKNRYYAYYYSYQDGKYHLATSDNEVDFGIAVDLPGTGYGTPVTFLTHKYDGYEFIFSVWLLDGNFYYGVSMDGLNFTIHPTPIIYDANGGSYSFSHPNPIIIENGIMRFWWRNYVGNITWNYGNYVELYGTAPELDWEKVQQFPLQNSLTC